MIQLTKLLKDLRPISYERNTHAKICVKALKAHQIRMGKYWHVVSNYIRYNLDLKGKLHGIPSTHHMGIPLDHKTLSFQGVL